MQIAVQFFVNVVNFSSSVFFIMSCHDQRQRSSRFFTPLLIYSVILLLRPVIFYEIFLYLHVCCKVNAGPMLSKQTVSFLIASFYICSPVFLLQIPGNFTRCIGVTRSLKYLGTDLKLHQYVVSIMLTYVCKATSCNRYS